MYKLFLCFSRIRETKTKTSLQHLDKVGVNSGKVQQWYKEKAIFRKLLNMQQCLPISGKRDMVDVDAG